MLPLKLVRSLANGDPFHLTQNPHFHHHQSDNLPASATAPDDNDGDNANPSTSKTLVLGRIKSKIPWMLFTPTQELVKDTYRLATIAREIGMDLHPNPSLSHIIFSWPSPPSSSSSLSSSPSTSTSYASSATASTSSWSWSLPNDSVPLPFPSFDTASLSHLRLFANLSKGFFKLVFLKNNQGPGKKIESLSNNNWDCTSLCLVSRFSGERIHSMDDFSKALLGVGWTLFKTNNSTSNSSSSKGCLRKSVYLYRKLDMNKVQLRILPNEKRDSAGSSDMGECCRVRELRLPPLDFGNVPLRILQYIVLMTDDVFYLA